MHIPKRKIKMHNIRRMRVVERELAPHRHGNDGAILTITKNTESKRNRCKAQQLVNSKIKSETSQQLAAGEPSRRYDQSNPAFTQIIIIYIYIYYKVFQNIKFNVHKNTQCIKIRNIKNTQYKKYAMHKNT